MLQLSDPVVQSYIFYSGVLAGKVLIMTILTARQRFMKKVFANPEDAVLSKGKVKFDDVDVERVRRAHLNDLENIPVFWVVGALYLTTSPAPATAVWLFRLVTAGRILHTLAYAIKHVPRARSLGFAVSYFSTFYMAAKVILHYSRAL